MRSIIASLAVLTLACGAQGQFVPGAEGLHGGNALSKPLLTMVTVASHSEVAPGQTFYVAAIVSIKPGYILYSPDPGGTKDFAPLPASLVVHIGEMGVPRSTEPASQPEAAAVTVGDIVWPPAKEHEYHLGDQTFRNRAYEGQITIFVPLTPKAAGYYQAQIVLDGQVCSESECVPVHEVELASGVIVRDKSVVNDYWAKRHLDEALAAARSAAAEARRVALQTSPEVRAAQAAGENYGLAAGFALALLAGLILNIMPCVLPVIPLKVLGMVQHAGQSRRRFVTLGLAFAGGVVMFFAGIAAVNVFLKLVLQSAFQWGEHFQSTPLRIAMAALMAVLAANLFGLFTVLAPRRAGAAEAAISQGKGHLRAIGMGLLTGVLATPCSFSILAAALAFAQGQTALVGSLAIMVIGVGMALPYALLTAFPGLVRRLPRPGRWMEIFKRTMGFAMLLVALWLLSTLFHDTYPFWIAGFVVLLILSIWMWGWWVRSGPVRASAKTPHGVTTNKVVVRALAVILAVSAASIMLPPPRPLAVQFVPFDQTRIDQASGSGRIVLVDFTAAWCLTCKQVEYTVYNNPEVAATIKDLDVLAVKGDITTADLPANQLKKKFGQGIPVTVIFPPGRGKPIVLDGLFSAERLVRELKDIAGKSSTTGLGVK